MEQHLEALKALADPVRLRLLQLLHDRGETCVCELVDELGTTQSNISTHLRLLRSAGLVSSQKIGKWVFYRLAQERLDALLTDLTGAFAAATAAHDRPTDSLFVCCQAGEVPLSVAAAQIRQACGAPKERCCDA